MSAGYIQTGLLLPRMHNKGLRNMNDVVFQFSYRLDSARCFRITYLLNIAKIEKLEHISYNM